MRSMSVRKVKGELSMILGMVRSGKRSDVRGRRTKARPSGCDVGFLDGKVTIEFTDDYEMTEDELIGAETEEER